jgi:hypothetical protein
VSFFYVLSNQNLIFIKINYYLCVKFLEHFVKRNKKMSFNFPYWNMTAKKDDTFALEI